MKKHTWFYSFIAPIDVAKTLYGNGIMASKETGNELVNSIIEAVTREYPLATILSISRID